MRELVGRVDQLHAAAATAADGLHQQRIADLGGHRPRAGQVGGLATGHDRAARRPARATGRVSLSPTASSDSGVGPTKTIPAAAQARASAGFSDRKP